MNINRYIDDKISHHFNTYKEVAILMGARQVGKTTLLKRLFPQAEFITADNQEVKDALNRYSPSAYKNLFKKVGGILVIDEIHQLTDPGRAAKIIYDQMPEYKLIITGSSSFWIKNKTSESLAGRKISYNLYPLTFSEMLFQKGLVDNLKSRTLECISKHKKLMSREIYPFDFKSELNNCLVYGLYPAMVNHPSGSDYLINLVDSVVFRDLLELSLLENKQAALNLLKLLAFQIGSLVNYTELASKLNIDVRTVRRYISLFEQSYIIFSLYPFSLNKRDEIGKTPKIYFYDTGLRNALIGNFSACGNRGDEGQLFENFIVCETLKNNDYGNYEYKLNYWRTKSGSEVDLVLSKRDEPLFAIEIKSRKKRVNSSFINRYKTAKLVVIDKFNFYQI